MAESSPATSFATSAVPSGLESSTTRTSASGRTRRIACKTSAMFSRSLYVGKTTRTRIRAR